MTLQNDSPRSEQATRNHSKTFLRNPKLSKRRSSRISCMRRVLGIIVGRKSKISERSVRDTTILAAWRARDVCWQCYSPPSPTTRLVSQTSPPRHAATSTANSGIRLIETRTGRSANTQVRVERNTCRASGGGRRSDKDDGEGGSTARGEANNSPS